MRRNPELLPHGWIIPARLGWLLFSGLGVALYVAAIPIYLRRMQMPCAPEKCIYFQLPELSATALQDFGVPLTIYGAFMTALVLATSVLFLGISAFLF